MITTTLNSTVHVLNILDQILLHMLVLTTIYIMVNMLSYTVTTHYGMEEDVGLKIVVAMMWECHGSSIFRDNEVRIGRDQEFADEGVAVEELQLYAQ